MHNMLQYSPNSDFSPNTVQGKYPFSDPLRGARLWGLPHSFLGSRESLLHPLPEPWVAGTVLGLSGQSWAWEPWIHPQTPGNTWEVPGDAWGRLGTSGDVWGCLGTSGSTLAPPGAAWSTLNHPGPFWHLNNLENTVLKIHTGLSFIDMLISVISLRNVISVISGQNVIFGFYGYFDSWPHIGHQKCHRLHEGLEHIATGAAIRKAKDI